MTYLVTRERLRAAGSCYGREREEELVPPDGLTVRQTAGLPIPHDDRMWALLCASGLEAERAVEFAIREVLRVSTDEGWRSWAEKWLSGEDRSEAAASEAAWEAEAARAAAWAAARAAWAWAVAARAAAWAAWAVAARAEAARAAAWEEDGDAVKREQLQRLVEFMEEKR